MKMKMYAVRDRATDQFGNAMFLITDGQAIRSFSDEVNRDAPDNNLANHSDDYDLFALGEYDTNTGLFETHAPKQIAIGKALRIK